MEFYSKNKFQKLVHPVGLIIRTFTCSKDTVSSPLKLRQFHKSYLQSKDATMQTEV